MKKVVHRFFSSVCLMAGLLLLTAVAAQATTYYVSTSGSNSNAGSQASPWRNIAFALKSSLLKPGDIISIGAGTFTETEVAKIPCGVSVIGAGNTATFIKSSASPLFLLENCQNGSNRQTISKFKLDGQSKAAGDVGLRITKAYGVSVSDLVVVDFKGDGGGGINLTYANNCSVSKSTLINNAVEKSTACGGNLSVAELENCYFYDLTIKDDNGYAVKNGIGPENTIKNTKFFNCRFEVFSNECSEWNTLAVELHIQHCENVHFFNCYFNNVLSIAESNTKRGLQIYNNHFKVPSGAGYAIEATSSYMHIHHNYFEQGLYAIANWGDRKSEKNYSIHHNVFDKQFYRIDLMHMPAGMTESGFYNNTLVIRNNDLKFWDLRTVAGDANKPVSRVDMKNNMFVGLNNIGDKFGDIANSTLTKNLFYNVTAKGSQPVTGDPKLSLSSSFPNAYIPGSGSAAIDAGVPIPGITDGSVDEPDLGAFEVGKTPWTIGVNSSPVAVARAFADKLTGAVPLTVNFDATTSIGSDLTYRWNLGNGQSPTAGTTSTTYTTAGYYRVSLIVSGNGRTDTTFLDVTATNGNPGSIADGAVYELQPQHATGLRLNNPGTATKTQVNVTTANNNNAQRWKFNRVGLDVYEIVPQNATSLKLDVSNASTTSGTPIQVYAPIYRLSISQQWKLLAIGNGIYELQPQAAPALRLDVANGGTGSGTGVVESTASGAARQRWKLLLVSSPTTTVQARAVASTSSGAAPLTVNLNGSTSTGSNLKYVWDLANGQKVTGSQVSVTYTTPGTFKVSLTVTDNNNNYDVTFLTITVSGSGTPAPSGIVDGAIYELEPQNATGLRMDVVGGVTASGTLVQIWSSNSTNAQRWKVTGTGSNIYELTPQHATGLRLDVKGGLSVDGTEVQVYNTNNSLAQRWKFIGVGSDLYELEPQNAIGKRLDVTGGGTARGTKLDIATAGGGLKQQFKLILISQPAARKSAEDVSPEESVTVYPNPGTGREIFIEVSNADKAGIELSNAQGREIGFGKKILSERKVLITPKGKLTSGLYLVRVQAGGMQSTRKIVIE